MKRSKYFESFYDDDVTNLSELMVFCGFIVGCCGLLIVIMNNFQKILIWKRKN